MQLLLATTNPAKLRDMKMSFSDLAADCAFVLVSPKDLVNEPFEVEETGATFAENAIQKAEAAAERFGVPAVADDGGLEIDALGGNPGVFSRRWPGYAADDETLIAYAVGQLKDIPKGQRGAQFRTVSAFAAPGGKTVTAEGVLRGEIAFRVHDDRDPGYPFRSLFVLPEFHKYMIELSDSEEVQLSHRRKSLLGLAPAIRSYFSHP